MSTASDIDVIVPCYKYGHLLRQCVTSVLTQDGVEVRVLILDDASPDDTPQVGAALAKEDPRVTYRRHAVNARHIATYNEGLAWADASCTLLLSADDFLTPGALRRAIDVFESQANVVMVYGRAKMLRDGEDSAEVAPADRAYPTRVIAGEQFLRDACTSGDNVVLTPTVIVRTELQHELGGYRPELVHSGDFEMWMRFATRGDIGYIDGPQAVYRVHSGNMSNGYPLLRDVEQRRLAFDAVFETQRRHIENADELHRTAMRSLATSAFWAGSHAFDRGEADVCRQFHEAALKIDPALRRTSKWIRFSMKRAVGSGAWRRIKPFVARVKG